MKKFIIAIVVLLILSALFFGAIKLWESRYGTAIAEIDVGKAQSPNFIRTKPAGPNTPGKRSENLERWMMAREKLGNCEKVRFISFDSAYCAD
jgi:hypothetical protein